MKDKAGTRSDLKAAKRSQVFFLNLEKKKKKKEVQKCLVNNTSELSIKDYPLVALCQM